MSGRFHVEVTTADDEICRVQFRRHKNQWQISSDGTRWLPVHDATVDLGHARVGTAPDPVAARPHPSKPADPSDGFVSSLVAAELTVLDGAGAIVQRQLLDRPTIVVGRSRSADLRVSDPLVSARHLEIERSGKRYIARDLKTTRGTTHNGKPLLGEHALSHGDQLVIGSTTLRFDNVVEQLGGESDQDSALASMAFPVDIEPARRHAGSDDFMEPPLPGEADADDDGAATPLASSSRDDRGPISRRRRQPEPLVERWMIIVFAVGLLVFLGFLILLSRL